MNPAERLARLKAQEVGLKAAIKQAEKDVREVREQTGAKSFDTPLGQVIWSVRGPSVGYDDEALLAWAVENMPHEVETVQRVRPSLLKTLDGRLRVDGGDVVDSISGEVVDYATVKPGSEYATVRLTNEAKTDAVLSGVLGPAE